MNDSMTHRTTLPVPDEVQAIRHRYERLVSDFEAGVATREEVVSRTAKLQESLSAFNASLPDPACPPWCNRHRKGYYLHGEDDETEGEHRLAASGEDWYFDIEGPAFDGRIWFEPMEYRSMTLAQAREYALGILRGLDAVDGRPASGRIGRRVYTTLVERKVDTDLLEALASTLGVDALDLAREED